MHTCTRKGQLLWILICLLSTSYPIISRAQLSLGYFADTTQRIGSYMTGSQVEGTDIYWWGSGISLFSLNAPLIYKVSANGSSIWNTVADSTFAGGGIIYSCFVEPDGIYSLG